LYLFNAGTIVYMVVISGTEA